ncbi:MAG: tripartite tricarboxylate transporter substrate binding protein [Betaproteobacteria bacterium]|nr:MAG: tripartite tricarboxylate transporter substrate binding protein [Betaproteobacteria bacterium]TMH90956.1 MAG: tripartite tricarboxylate transporter substrate binding protein [Betaproteobacteria bacterium]
MLAWRCSRPSHDKPMRRASLSLLAALVVTDMAIAQSWPSRPVRMIVPQAAGGMADIVARVISSPLARELGQQVLVDNRAGDATLGAQAAARAQADGYTYLLAPASVLAVDQYMAKILPYSPEDDFASVAMVGSIPFALIANPELNVNTLAELIALAKANPGKLAFASPGPRTLPGMLGETLKIRAGVSLLQVPYKGVQDTIAGRIQLAIQGIPAIAAVVQRGQLRALAVSSPRRIPELPEVATFSETLPGFEFNGWFAVVAPTGTPRAPIERMNLEFNRILLDGVMEQRLRALGLYTEGTGAPKEIDAFLESERAFWSRVVRELKIEPE